MKVQIVIVAILLITTSVITSRGYVPAGGTVIEQANPCNPTRERCG